MRNLKRALSLALATVMTLGLMVVGTGATGNSPETSEAHQEPLQLHNDEFDPAGSCG